MVDFLEQWGGPSYDRPLRGRIRYWVQYTHVRQDATEQKEVTMIWTIFVVLVILWLLGLVSSYTMGGFIHILLVVAVIVLVLGLFKRR
jgi:fatty acid desaturase